MKKLYTIIICIFISALTLKAQPVLNSSEMLPFNSECNYSHPNGFSIIDTTIQGTNRMWDFHTITPDIAQGTYEITIMDPASTPYGVSYPNSNYCLKEMPGSTYNYYNLNSAAWERVGSSDSTGGSHYSDTQKELVFPLQYGTTNSDTWESDGSSFPGTYDLKCIGTGTLKLPNATYTNALFVRAYLVNSFLELYSYFWYSSDNGAVLLQYIPGDGFWVPETAIYLTSMTIGVEENEVAYKVYYNNPVDDKLNLTFVSNQNAVMEYTVINSMGDILDRSSFRTSVQQTNKLELDFSRYSSGIYFVRFGNESGSNQNMKSIKLIKN
jgi:hypothetical protein